MKGRVANRVSPVIDCLPRFRTTRVSSARGELGAQDRRNVLALTQQPDHIQMVAALEVAPRQRKLRGLSGPKPWNVQSLSGGPANE
jgi:hypothetical protein